MWISFLWHEIEIVSHLKDKQFELVNKFLSASNSIEKLFLVFCCFLYALLRLRRHFFVSVNQLHFKIMGIQPNVLAV